MTSPLDRNPTLTLPEFKLESGITLHSVDVVYKTWGALNAERNNVMVICHPFTGSADVHKWWSPLMGCGKAFDTTRFFIFCANVLGSPFGTTSPLSIDPSTGKAYGPKFPATTIRDDVRLHKMVLDHLGVTSVAVAIGGSMGGMTVLEWQLCFPGFVHRAIPIATCAKQSAWCISWGEVKRQIIWADPAFMGGHYPADRPPTYALAIARMAGLLSYRSPESYEERFGRRIQDQSASHAQHAIQLSNEEDKEYPYYETQSYLRAKGASFVGTFDANCYLHIIRKMDTHDIVRDRMPLSLPGPNSPTPDAEADAALAALLATLPPRPLVISISSDILCPPREQALLAQNIPEADLVVIDSVAGHDGFLVEHERINEAVVQYLEREFPELYSN
ncbi:Homoserine O-acetyltransferase [Mycena sanguinolenta]|uniref:Homoserine O-acetyltransferase n=1 Tax=Mycena sanguinolenta TaxID=230812 RepID=A0A8H6XB65_9AGAR|nr:Homoserine O-acetyltransferase [Mycena sanguinolenta]